MMNDYVHEDQDGTTLSIEWCADGEPVVHASDCGVILTREAVHDLHQQLGDYLRATNNTAAAVTTPLPDATADGYDWPDCLVNDLRVMATSGSPGSPRAARLGEYADRIDRELVEHPEGPTVAREAERIVYGDREGDYGHPREDFTRTAVIWTGLLQHKLADGAYIEPEDIARCMVGVKLSRDVHSPKRDNRVDGIGYLITLDRLETGK